MLDEFGHLAADEAEERVDGGEALVARCDANCRAALRDERGMRGRRSAVICSTVDAVGSMACVVAMKRRSRRIASR